MGNATNEGLDVFHFGKNLFIIYLDIIVNGRETILNNHYFHDCFCINVMVFVVV